MHSSSGMPKAPRFRKIKVYILVKIISNLTWTERGARSEVCQVRLVCTGRLLGGRLGFNADILSLDLDLGGAPRVEGGGGGAARGDGGGPGARPGGHGSDRDAGGQGGQLLLASAGCRLLLGAGLGRHRGLGDGGFMFPDRGVQLVVYHGVLLVSAGREGEGGPDLDLGGDIAGDIEQHRVTPCAGPHEDGHLVTLGLSGGGRLGVRSLLKRINE